MDEALIAAYRHLVVSHQCSAEDILEDPELRCEFLAEVRHIVGNLPERQLLHRLSSLRKRSLLPRSREIVAG
jgi:hypothetical protein